MRQILNTDFQFWDRASNNVLLHHSDFFQQQQIYAALVISHLCGPASWVTVLLLFPMEIRSPKVHCHLTHGQHAGWALRVTRPHSPC
jgi:hypothetical protein